MGESLGVGDRYLPLQGNQVKDIFDYNNTGAGSPIDRDTNAILANLTGLQGYQTYF